MLDGFVPHRLDDGHVLYVGLLPPHLLASALVFEVLWDLHPIEYIRIKMVGREVQTPRWQQAYGRNYEYSGQINTALPTPEELAAFRSWAGEAIDSRLNGLLLNWYDGSLGHYIGPHRDSTKGLIPGSPIVTISLGEERIFRLTKPQTKLKRDFMAENGTVFIMPYECNLVWRHSVPRFRRYQGRRISITLRAFED